MIIGVSSLKAIPKETGSEIEVYFCPREDCETVLVEIIKDGGKSVHCAFFDLKLKKVIDELKKKGRDVKLVVDRDNSKHVKGLNFVRTDNRKAFMHNKFCVIDRKKIITGSMNPTDNGAHKNNNNLVVVESKHLAKNYEEEFEELWGGKFGKGREIKYSKIMYNGKLIENCFCPEDDCEKKVIESLSKAEKSVHFMVFSFTSVKIGDYLISRKDLTVKGIFEKMQNSKWSQYRRMDGMKVKLDNNPKFLHHKVFIIDNKTVITGSYNPTKSGNERNDENVLIIHDKRVAKKYLEEFGKLWVL